MESGSEECGLMAETLIVLTGENAWSAARVFHAQSAREGDLNGARYWRSVARSLLRKIAMRLVSPAEECATPNATPAAPEAPAEAHEVPIVMPEIRTAESDSATGWKNLGRAPIPLRARRQSSWPATAGIEADANGCAVTATPEQTDVARAA